MILPDANLLLYAEDSLSERHDKARTWWDGVLSGSEPVNLCWPVLNAFIRIATNARLHQRPLKSGEAMARVQSWFEQPCVRVVNPSENHWALFQRQIRDSGAVGSLIPDAHLAALAIEHGCTLFSADQDFAKFPALRWVNPLSGSGSEQVLAWAVSAAGPKMQSSEIFLRLPPAPAPAVSPFSTACA